MPRELEEWGGDVHLPAWLRRLLRRPAPADDTPERSREAPKAPTDSVARAANRAAGGELLNDLYWEGRRKRR